ncbi:MAG: protease HtpX [Pseudomonadota bacterium]
MTRILLFLGTNAAILLVVSVVFSVFGIDDVVNRQTGGMNLTSLLLMSAVIGFTGSFISLFASKWMAKRSMGVQLIDVDRPTDSNSRWLVETVRRQAQEAGIKMPEVGIWDAPDMNAFATGWNRNDALVAVSTGLLRGMQADEVEAVLAHEIAHVANGDMVTLTLIQGVVNTFVVFASRIVGHLVDRAVFRTTDGHGPGYFIVSMVMQVVFSVLASVIVMWFSRYREFRADEGGARLAGREKMIRALERLQRGGGELPDEMAAMGISGGRMSGLKKLFMTHPPLEERIAALQAQR